MNDLTSAERRQRDELVKKYLDAFNRLMEAERAGREGDPEDRKVVEQWLELTGGEEVGEDD